MNTGSNGNRNSIKKKNIEGIKPYYLWIVTNISDTITCDGVKYTIFPHHKSKYGSVEGIYMKAPHNHNKWAESRKQNVKSQWKCRKDNQGANSDATTPDGSPSQSSSNKSKSLKLSLNQNLATDIVTQHHMTHWEADETLKDGYNDAGSPLNYQDPNWGVEPWVT